MDPGFGEEGAQDSSRQTSALQAGIGPGVAANHPPTPSARPGASSSTLSAPPQPRELQQPQHPPHASPLKRRGSDGPGAENGGTASAGESASSVARATGNDSTHGVAGNSSSSVKRARPETRAPKVLPERYEQCDVEDMVVLIASMIGELIETNDPRALQSGNLTRFHSRTAPGISVVDYLFRLAKHATLTPPLLLSMVYYIDRLCAMYAEFTINTLTVHRFLITAATVAAKGLSDSFWNNTTYARVGGLRVAELKMLELEFLYRLDWKIVPNPEVLEAYYRPLVERCPGYVLVSSPSEEGEEIGEGDSSIEDEEDEGQEEQSEDLADNGVPDTSGDVNMTVGPGGGLAGTDNSHGRGQPHTALHPHGGGTQGSHMSVPKKGHSRQSSTNLIGEDMVASGGLTGPPGP